MLPPRAKQPPRTSPPFRWTYRGQARPAPDTPYPYSNQAILRRRAEIATQAYLQSQANTFLDPGLNPNVANRIRREYGLSDDSDIRGVTQAIGAGAGAFLGGKKGMATGAGIGTAFGGPVGTGIGAVAGTIVGAIAGGFTGAAVGGTITPSGLYGTYDLTRGMILDTLKNPVGGAMHASTVVGNTMGQLKGVPVIRSAILALQGDNTLDDNLRRAYGFHDEGFSRLDFSRIRKNTGLDLPFGNAVVDFIGEMALDPINWERGAKRKILSTVSDGSVVILSADSIDDPLLSAMDVGTMKKVGELALDSIHDPGEANQQFANLIRSNPQLRQVVESQLTQTGSEAFLQYTQQQFTNYSDRILSLMTNEDANYFGQILMNTEQAKQSIDKMRQINPNFNSYEQLSNNLQMHFKRKGFKFKPVHMYMLEQQYPALKRSVEITNLQNKWLMKIANPGLTAGTEGIKKLIDIVKSGDARDFLVKHFGEFNQGRVPFIDINDSGGIISIKPTKEYQERKDNWVKLTDELNIEREERKQELRDILKNDKVLDDLYTELSELKKEENAINAALKKERDELFKSINVYDGDDIIDDYMAKIYKKELTNLKSIERPSTAQQKEIERLTSLIQAHQNIKNYEKIDNELIHYYINAEHTLNQIYVVKRRFENQFKELKSLGRIPRGRSFESWLKENDEYQASMAIYEIANNRFMNELQDAINQHAELFGTKDPENKNLVSKKERLMNHPALKYMKDVKVPKVGDDDQLMYQELIQKGIEDKHLNLFEDTVYTTFTPVELVDPVYNDMRIIKGKINKELDQGFKMELDFLGINNEEILRTQRVDYRPFKKGDFVQSLNQMYDLELKKEFSTKHISDELLNDIINEIGHDVTKEEASKYIEFLIEDKMVNEYGIEDHDTLRDFIGAYKNHLKSSAFEPEEDGYVSAARLYDDIDWDEVEDFFHKYFDIDMDDLATNYSAALRAEFTGINLHIDGKSIDLGETPQPEDFIEYLINNFNLTHRKAEWDKLKNSSKIPFYHTQDVMRFYDEVAKDFIHFQSNQNIVKLQQYLDPENIRDIQMIYDAMVNPEQALGPYRLFGEVAQDIKESQSYENARRNVINIKHSADLMKKIVENEKIKQGITQPYPKNEVVGPLFDAIYTINDSRIMDISSYKVGDEIIPPEDLKIRLTLKLKELRETLENNKRVKDAPEIIDFLMDDLYDKLILSPDSILNEQEHSVYATGAYFTELNKRVIDKVYAPFKDTYEILREQVRDAQHLERNKKKHQQAIKVDTSVPQFEVTLENVPYKRPTLNEIKADPEHTGPKDVAKVLKKLTEQRQSEAILDHQLDFIETKISAMGVEAQPVLKDIIDEVISDYPQGAMTLIEVLESIIGQDVKMGHIEALTNMVREKDLAKNINNLVKTLHQKSPDNDKKLIKSGVSFWFSYMREADMKDLAPDKQITGMTFDETRLTATPPFLADFKEHINGFRDRTREPLQETKFINQNLKSNLFTKTYYNKEILTKRPFDPSGLVSSNSPITVNMPLDVNWNARQKRLLKTLVPEQDDMFKHHYTARDLAETMSQITGKMYEKYEQIIKDYTHVRNEVNQRMGNISTKTRLDEVIWAAFDVETTSLQKGIPENLVVQLAATTGKSDFDRKIIGHTLDEFFTSLTGITQESVDREGRPAEEVFKEFFKFAEDKGLIAHNLNFDWEHLEKGLKSLGPEYNLDNIPKLDTLDLSRKLYGKQLQRNTLEAVFTYLQEDIRNKLVEEMGELAADDYLKSLAAHNALDDSHMTYLIAQEMIDELQKMNINYVEEIAHDYMLQVTEREQMMGETLSGSYTLSGDPYGMSEASRDVLEELEFAKQMGVDDNTLADLRSQMLKHYDNWEYNRFGVPTALDMKMFNTAKELIGRDDEVFEFYEMVGYLKNNIGLNSTEGKYSLMDYNERFAGNPLIEQRIEAFTEIMKQYDQDITEDDVKKMFAYYSRKRSEIPEKVSNLDKDQLLSGHFEQTIEEMIEGIKDNHKRYSDAIVAHRNKSEQRAELLGRIGQFEEKTNSKSKKTIFKMMSSVPDSYLESYLEEVFKDVDIDIQQLLKEVKAYRENNPDNLDWTHPLINKLKAYMGEPGEWEIMRPKEQQLKHTQSKLDNLLKRKDASPTVQKEILDLQEQLHKATRDRIFGGKDTQDTQEKLLNELKKYYDKPTLNKAREYLEELNQLKIDTHRKRYKPSVKYRQGKIKLEDGTERLIPMESDNYVINFKQNYVDGIDPGLVEIKERREKIIQQIEERKDHLKKIRDKKREEFQKMYGYYNVPEARKRVDELADLLKQGDYNKFRIRYKKYFPHLDDKSVDKFINMFEEEVVQKRKGKQELLKVTRRELFKESPKKLGKMQDIKEAVVTDTLDPLAYLTGEERYEDYMEADMEYIKMHLEIKMGKEQLTGEWVPGEKQLAIGNDTDVIQRPRVNRLNRLEQFYNMDLQEIQGSFKDGQDLQQFLDNHPEYKLVATVHDDSEAVRNPSQWYTEYADDGSVKDIKRKTAYQKYNLTDKALLEKEAFIKGEYDVNKPAIKELLFNNPDELDDLFTQYNPSEVSVGIMSINDFKVAKNISYKPFELPGPLDWFYKNILRLQKSDMLLNSSWHMTNFVDIGRKNSQMMEGIWEADDFADKTLEAGDLYFAWNDYRRNMLKYLNEQESILDDTTDPEQIELLRSQLEELGSMGFDQYLEKRGFMKDINKISDIDLNDDLNLGTRVYRKLKNSKSFEGLSEADKVHMINERQRDLALMLKEVDAFQTSTATTDLPQYIQKMDEKMLGDSTSLHRQVFRWLGTENPVMRTNMKVATNLEQVGRLHGYLLDRHLHGTSHDAALMRSLKRHFDYSDKSLMEKYLTLVFPFIAFPTRNALFWQEQLQDAAKNRRYYHFINAAWGRFDTETNQYAQAMRSKGYIPIGNTLVKVGDSRASALNMGTNFGDVAMSRLNPLLRAPIQALRGETDKTTGRQIAEALPLIRRIPQTADQLRNIQDRGLSHRTVFPGVFGTIYDDSDYRRPVFRANRNTYNSIFNQQGQYRQLSNNAYYRVRQIQNEQHRRRRL